MFEKLRLPFNMRDAPISMFQVDQSYVKATKANKRQRPTLYPATMIPGQCLITFDVLILKQNGDYVFYIKSTSLRTLKNQHYDADLISAINRHCVGTMCLDLW